MGELDFSDKFLKTFKYREVVFEEGSVGKHMYVVVSGRVDIRKKGSDGDAVVATLGEGEVFGEMALVDSLPRSATAVSGEDDTTVVEIDHAQFAYLVGQQPAFALVILKALSLRLRRQMEINAGTGGPGKGSRP